MKNLVDAVKQGALKLEQVKEENAELEETQRRLEKRLHDLTDSTRLAADILAILDTFDHDFGHVLTELITDRLQFNSFVRLFFSAIVIEVKRPGMDWRKRKKRGELPVWKACIRNYSLEPGFGAFVDQSGYPLPDDLKQAERQSPAYLSERHGSP